MDKLLRSHIIGFFFDCLCLDVYDAKIQTCDEEIRAERGRDNANEMQINLTGTPRAPNERAIIHNRGLQARNE